MQNFAARLKTAIEDSGKPKGDLAAHCGVALSTVSRWLAGSVPGNETLEKIASFTGTDPIWLLTGVDRKRLFEPKSPADETMVREDPTPYRVISRIERATPNQESGQTPNEEAPARPVEERVDRLELAFEKMALAIERLAIAMEAQIRKGEGDE